jgi:ATP/maltotriose-dependent transcriptional regulator MalT
MCARVATQVNELAVETPTAVGYRCLVRAEIERGADQDTVDGWQEAVVAWRAAGEPYPLAYALLRLAEAAVTVGERESAADALNEAVDIGRGLGARPLLEDAQALARRARIAVSSESDEAEVTVPAPVDPLARFGLTEREREVLGLLVAGRSNPQIAQELFISAKTASVHVSNILGKLGVGSRGEAAAVAHRLGVTSP